MSNIYKLKLVGKNSAGEVIATEVLETYTELSADRAADDMMNKHKEILSVQFLYKKENNE